MKKHFVEFLFPGLMFAETTTKPIDFWHVREAQKMAESFDRVKPYGFRFITRERGDADLDSKITKTSGTYYLGGKVETLAQVKRRATQRDTILVSNMEGNGYGRIITTPRGFTVPFTSKDKLLGAQP